MRRGVRISGRNTCLDLNTWETDWNRKSLNALKIESKRSFRFVFVNAELEIYPDEMIVSTKKKSVSGMTSAA